MKSILLILFISASISCFAQSYRISENSKAKDVDVFITPGISPNGLRLMQFSFIQVKQFKSEIQTERVLLFTEEGMEILLKNPIKDTSYKSSSHQKGWYASYSLSELDIATLRTSKITHIQVKVGNQMRKFPISSKVSIEMNNLIVSKF